MKRIVEISLIVLLVVVLALFGRRLHRLLRQTKATDSASDRSRILAIQTEESVAGLPAISLQINKQHSLTEFQGTPLILEVRLANPRASNAELENLANEAYIEEIQADVAAGKLTQPSADQAIARSSGKAKVGAVTIGGGEKQWYRFIHFEEQLADSTSRPLTWPLRLLAEPQEKAIVLDAENVAGIKYAIEPDAAKQIDLGDHRIVAVVQVTPADQSPIGRWTGRAESDPVKLSIAPPKSGLSSSEGESINLQFARYFKALGDQAQTLKYAEKALAARSVSIPALTLIGDIKQQQGDVKSALKAYARAESEFFHQYPDSIEPPVYLFEQIGDLTEKPSSGP